VKACYWDAYFHKKIVCLYHTCAGEVIECPRDRSVTKGARTRSNCMYLRSTEPYLSWPIKKGEIRLAELK
jgi:hypothetical protein